MSTADEEVRNDEEWRSERNWFLGSLVYVSRRDSRMVVPKRGDYQMDPDSVFNIQAPNLGNWRTCAVLAAVFAPLVLLLVFQRRAR